MNVDLYCLYAAKLNSGLKVIAIEPAEQNLRELKRNCELNALFTQISTVLCALSSENGERRLSSVDQGVESSGAQLDSLKVFSQRIEVQTLDGLITALRKTSSAAKLVAVKLDTQMATELMSRLGPKPHLMERAIHPILVDTHPHNRLEINRSLKRFGMFEYLN